MGHIYLEGYSYMGVAQSAATLEVCGEVREECGGA